MAVSLKELRRRFYDRMDEPSDGQSNYVTPQQAADVLNEGYSLLWGIYSRKVPDFFDEEVTIKLGALQMDYLLPADFRASIQAYWMPQGPGKLRIPMMRLNKQRASYPGNIPAYGIIGDHIRIDPPLTTVRDEVVLLWYRPTYIPLVADEDTINSRIYPGHEQLVINQAVIMIKIGKEEQPAPELIAMQAALRAEVEADLVQRDLGGGERIVVAEPYEGWVV